MSDGFDKEAEREKLREKLADDDEKREHTQRMSELLLKGATMTNRHCDDCGDPIFRQDGREFCPTCHTVDAADVPEAGAGKPTGRDGDAAATPAGGVDGGDLTSVTDAGDTAEGADAANGVGTADAPGTRASAAQTSSPVTETTPDAAGPRAVDDARESLVRTLTRFASAAEQTDDPRRAREHLRAAREAAEALAALDR
ncbi:Sjogren's syndrome/scleroderma autoantigen 1 family protein [Halorubrum sp. DTA46]|uniref:Sjogren's syndrome/scleroderma autoantigen 1 family protein n=1 Tax=Halorubrum sp. DTA46 TaxID=3402162 RepID=UPI003AAAA596